VPALKAASVSSIIIIVIVFYPCQEALIYSTFALLTAKLIGSYFYIDLATYRKSEGFVVSSLMKF
jgi:hypothetical protein